MTVRPASRARAWVSRWRPILPLFVAEFVLAVGFGALIPVLPLYVVAQGIDMASLGVILAAWPAARLIFEPLFGWLADRTARRPLMVAGLVLTAVVETLPLVFASGVALLALRFAAGVTTAMYDPAARGYLVDSTEEDERGEAFGFFTAAQMGGFLVGPAIGTLGATLVGGYAVPFLLAGAMSLVAAVYLAVVLPERPLRPGQASGPSLAPITETSFAEYGADSPEVAARWAAGLERDRHAAAAPRFQRQAPMRALLNRPFGAALAMNFGVYFTIGVYEVVWSLYMQRLGASLALIGLAFAVFSLPVLVLAPFAGRLVDRVGGLAFAAVGGFVVAILGPVYASATEPIFPTVMGAVEGSAHAFLGPAMFAILAVGTPVGRSSTAQGIFGAVGTVAFVVASSGAGILYGADWRYPFYAFGVVALVAFGLGVALARGRDRARVAADTESAPPIEEPPGALR